VPGEEVTNDEGGIYGETEGCTLQVSGLARVVIEKEAMGFVERGGKDEYKVLSGFSFRGNEASRFDDRGGDGVVLERSINGNSKEGSVESTEGVGAFSFDVCCFFLVK